MYETFFLFLRTRYVFACDVLDAVGGSSPFFCSERKENVVLMVVFVPLPNCFVQPES